MVAILKINVPWCLALGADSVCESVRRIETWKYSHTTTVHKNHSSAVTAENFQAHALVYQCTSADFYP